MKLPSTRGSGRGSIRPDASLHFVYVYCRTGATSSWTGTAQATQRPGYTIQTAYLAAISKDVGIIAAVATTAPAATPAGPAAATVASIINTKRIRGSQT